MEGVHQNNGESLQPQTFDNELYQAKQYYLQGNYEAAFEIYLPRANAGAIEAQRYIASMYKRGYGVDIDIAQALGWYVQVIKQCDPLWSMDALIAMESTTIYADDICSNKLEGVTLSDILKLENICVEIERIYRDGTCADINCLKANQWGDLAEILRKIQTLFTAENPNETEWLTLADQLYDVDEFMLSYIIYDFLGRQNEVESVIRMAGMLARGEGVKLDLEAATDEITRAAKLLLTYTDYDVKEFFDLAIEEGFPEFIEYLFNAYMHGVGVEQNLALAKEYAVLAANHENPRLLYALAKYYYPIYAIGGNFIIAKDYSLYAAEKGCVEAYAYLAVLYIKDQSWKDVVNAKIYGDLAYRGGFLAAHSWIADRVSDFATMFQEAKGNVSGEASTSTNGSTDNSH